MIRFSRIRWTLLIVLVVSLFTAAGASAAYMSKLSPDLRLTLSEGFSKAPLDYSKTVAGEGEASVVRLVVRAECSAQTLRQAGMNVISQVGDVFSGVAPLSSVAAIASIPEVIAVQTPSRMKSYLDYAVPAVEGNMVRSGVSGSYTGYTGNGVIIGVIDTGLDLAHPDFQNPDGTTRVLYYWDQTLDGTPPSDFTFGAECTQDQINAGQCDLTDTDGHGTQVAGIAAGNGSATGNGYPAYRYVGMAPDAELIIVNAYESNGGFFTDRVIDAINYIQSRAQALGRPVVINMSMGTQDCAHDGTSLLARSVDAASGPGNIFVISAGNEGNNAPVTQPRPSIHADGMLVNNGDTDTIAFVIPQDQCRNTGALNDYIEIIMWYQGGDAFLIRVTSPHGYVAEASSGQINPEDTRNTQDGYIVINNAFGGVDPSNFDNEARISIQDFFDKNSSGQSLPIGGTWTIEIIAQGTNRFGDYDLWIPSSQFCNRVDKVGFATSSSATNVFNRKLVGSPGTSTSAITVGAFVSRNSWVNENGTTEIRPLDIVGDIAFFSSPGPTRDARSKPDISAPGQNIGSSLIGPPESTFAFPIVQILDDGVHVISLGTSFSAPIITGMAALFLQDNLIKTGGAATLQSFQLKNQMAASAQADSFTGAVPNNVWGAGKLDALAAMTLTPPQAPVLELTKRSSSQMDIAWTVALDPTSVIIERQVGEGGPFTVLDQVSGVSSYSDLNVVKDTFYGYRVTAVYGELRSAPSNEVGGVAKSSGGGGGGCFISTILP